MPRKRRSSSLATTVGGVLAGWEQQVMRRQPPHEELVRHARPDDPVPAAGGWLIRVPDGDDPLTEPIAGGDHEAGREAESADGRRARDSGR